MPTDPAAAFDAVTLGHIEAIVDHLNANHADAVLFVGRHLARRDDSSAPAFGAELGAVDPLGVDLLLRSPEGPRKRRLAFDAPISSGHELQAAFVAALATARGAAGPDEPPTSIERANAATETLPTRFGYLARRRRLTPQMVEITIGGLHTITTRGGDEFWFVLATEDGSEFPPGWSMAEHRERAEGNPIVGAYYTTRAARPDEGELDLWVMGHGHPAGAAARLTNTPTGSPVAVWGPRHGFRAPTGATSLLLVADETGTAAVAGVIESQPASTAIIAVLETVDTAHQLPLPQHPALSVRWVHRGDEMAGGRTNRLLDAVREACAARTPEAAFGAAESRHISAVRRYVRHELGLSAQAVLMTGYWRQDRSMPCGGEH